MLNAVGTRLGEETALIMLYSSPDVGVLLGSNVTMHLNFVDGICCKTN